MTRQQLTEMPSPTVTIRGELRDFSRPWVMGIVNVTPDSFFAGSRTFCRDAVRERVERLRAEGADVIDIGGYSSRPGADEVSADEEYRRLALALESIREIWPEALVSVDTFRAGVARRCVEEWGVEIINDISGGDLDPEMWPAVASLGCVYILMHMRGNPATMQSMTDYEDDDVTAEVVRSLRFKIAALRQLGVADIIVDPGFGFAKTPQQSLRLLAEMRALRQLGCPVLAALSHKSMIYKTLGITPEESLNGTVVLDTVALLNGADMIRVHDVREAVETVTLLERMGAFTR